MIQFSWLPYFIYYFIMRYLLLLGNSNFGLPKIIGFIVDDIKLHDAFISNAWITSALWEDLYWLPCLSGSFFYLFNWLIKKKRNSHEFIKPHSYVSTGSSLLVLILTTNHVIRISQCIMYSHMKLRKLIFKLSSNIKKRKYKNSMWNDM